MGTSFKPFMFLFIGVIALIGGWLAIVPLLIVPLVLIVAWAVQPFIKKYSKINSGHQKGKMATLLELLNNVETVRTVAGGGFLEKRWNETIQATSSTGIKARTINNIATTFSQSALQISSTGIVCVGVFLIASQSITTGALIACVILSGRILSPLVQIGQLLTRLNSVLISYKNIDQLMSDISRDEETDNQKAVIINSGEIQINDLDYNINEAKILSKINFSLKDGEKLGLVGNIGSGKSSLIKNIIGYNLPSPGTIFLSKYDLINIPSENLRQNIGYCSQHVQLFSGSIYENITAGLTDVSEVWGSEVSLYYPELYAGTTDLVGVYKDAPAILDFKQARKLKKKEWIDSYFMQSTAYAIMWEERTGIPINQIVVVIAVDNEEPQIFIEKRENWTEKLIQTIAEYNSRKNI